MPAPEIEVPMDVMFFDTDMGGVVHNIAYLRMIEVARTRLASKLGFDLRTMADEEIYPVVVRTEIDYRKPARLGDDLIVRGIMSEKQRVRFWCDFEIRRPEDEVTLVTCRQALALVQMPGGKILPLPEGFGA